MTNIFRLISIIWIAAKNQIIDPANLNPTFVARILLKLLTIISYPLRFFTKHELLPLPQRVKSIAETLGPIYVKLGQILSTRPDIVGEDLANELKKLQDAVKPIETEIIEREIRKAFNKELEEVFSFFDPVPVASASIAQVHKAILLKNGQVVAIKVLRPNIRKLYESDVQFLQFIAKLLARLFSKIKLIKPEQLIEILYATMKAETDLRMEAAACSEMRDNLKMNEHVIIPRVLWEFSSDNILVTEYIECFSIYNDSKLQEFQINKNILAEKIAILFFEQAYKDGVFHADLHPGNLLITPEGKLVLLDFGIIGRLSEEDRMIMAEILYGFINRDYLRVAKVHLRAQYIPKETNVGLFAQACRSIGEPIIGLTSKDVSIAKLLNQMFQVAEDFGMRLQPQLMLLQKTLLNVEGIGKLLNPNINMWELAKPWIEKWAYANLTPEAKIFNKGKKILSKLIEELLSQY